MSHEPRDMAASVRFRLLQIAREGHRDFDSILLLFMQERLMYRISSSRFRDAFVLKGGLFLFSVEGMLDRPTKDIDLLARHFPCDDERLKRIFQEIIALPGRDGLLFDPDSLNLEPIREGADYHGFRVRITGLLGSTRKVVQIDVGFGDIVVPKPRQIDFPVFLNDCPVPTIMAYSIESVVAEKFEAMVKLSTLNSRMKDFFDVDYLARHRRFDGRVLQEAIKSTFERRTTPLERKPAVFTDDFSQSAEKGIQWRAFLRRIGQDAASVSFERTVRSLRAFLEPVWTSICDETDFFGVWNPERAIWETYEVEDAEDGERSDKSGLV